jgi:hypothetical protein
MTNQFIGFSRCSESQKAYRFSPFRFNNDSPNRNAKPQQVTSEIKALLCVSFEYRSF